MSDSLSSGVRDLKLSVGLSVLALAQVSAAHACAQSDDAALVAALREQGARAHTHRLVWTSVNGALAVGSFALIPFVARDSRKDFVVSGVGSVLGTAATVFFPLRVETDAAELDAIESLPPAERSARLRELFRADADDERERLAWPWHVANLGVSALAGGIIGFGFHHAESGIAQGVGSFVLGEAQLFTQPTGLCRFNLAPMPASAMRERTWGFVVGAAF